MYKEFESPKYCCRTCIFIKQLEKIIPDYSYCSHLPLPGNLNKNKHIPDDYGICEYYSEE